MTDDPLIGQEIDGRYRISGIIGRGGMAVVYRATQTAMSREVAVKVIAPGIDAEGQHEFLDRFKREAKIVARLEHPHILPVFDSGEFRNQAYLVMRLLEGGDLKDRMRQKPLTVDESVRIIKQVASALTHAHENGIVHRDLKPQNILIDRSGNPYLMDFGIAKALDATREMTAAGTIMGTPSYMAPEQWRSEPVDARTDVYALGVIAYAMLAGTLPFESDTPFSLMYMHLDEQPDPLEERNSTLPLNLTEVVFKAMAKNPEDRFASAIAFGQALEDAVRNPGTTMHSRSADSEFETFIATDVHSTMEARSNALPTKVRDSQPEDIHTQATIIEAPDKYETRQVTSATLAPLEAEAVPARRLPLMWMGLAVVAIVILIAAAVLVSGGESPESDIPVLETGEALVTATRGILYTEPDTRSNEVTIAPEDAELEIIGANADRTWYRVKFLNDEGWILATQIQVFGDVNTIALLESPTPPPASQTPIVATSVACVLTAQSGEVNVRSQPNTSATSEVVAQIFGGDTVTVTAQTADGWYLTDSGWIFGSVMRVSSPFVCGSLPVVNSGVEVASAQQMLCEVLTSDAQLYRGASFSTVALTAIPSSTTLEVYEVARGEAGQVWYRTIWQNASGVVFQGWVAEEAAGPVAGSCPQPPEVASLFGDPYINPLALTQEPAYADGFDDNSGEWTLFTPNTGEVIVEDGLLRFTLPPRSTNGLIVGASEVGMIGDAYISLHLTVPPGLGELYFVEEVVRAFYTLRLSELGGVTVAAESNPGLVFGSTPDNTAPLIDGVTLGVHLVGNQITVYANGQPLLEIEDASRAQGLPFRIRLTNRATETDLTLLIDNFAYWDLSQ